MASTSTNKQPLLMDHVLHYVFNLDLATNAGLDVSGANTAQLILDSTSSDGAIVEDLYLISRGTDEYTVNLFLSTANDYLRPNQGYYIGSAKSAPTPGQFTSFFLPKALAPVPQVGDYSYNQALYVGRGYALWAARADITLVSNGPNIGLQGGWY